MQKLSWKRIAEGDDIIYQPRQLPEGFTKITIINDNRLKKPSWAHWQYHIIFQIPDAAYEDILGLTPTLADAQTTVKQHVKRLTKNL